MEKVMGLDMTAPHELPDETLLNDIGIPARTINCLRNLAGKRPMTMGDMRAICADLNRHDLLNTPNFGQKSLNLICEYIPHLRPQDPRTEAINRLAAERKLLRGRIEWLEGALGRACKERDKAERRVAALEEALRATKSA